MNTNRIYENCVVYLMKDRAPSYLFGVVLKLNSLEV